ncbi:MAG: hypothetical protein ABI707_11285 [Ferruginibacter sp.]
MLSQHANTLKILAGIAYKNEPTSPGKQILTDTTFAQCTVYLKPGMHYAFNQRLETKKTIVLFGEKKLPVERDEVLCR